MGHASAADVVYRTNRVFQATDSTIGEARVFNIANATTNLTGIILAGSPITTNSHSATEREGVSWGQPSATQAWQNITNGGQLQIGTYTNIFDDPGWIKGVKSVTMGGNTSHGAYMWYLQNNLSFTTPGSTFYTNAGKTYLLDKVLVGTLGDYLPGTNYTETFPKMDDPAASNYPGCTFLTSEMPAESETVKYSFDTTAYYRVVSLTGIVYVRKAGAESAPEDGLVVKTGDSVVYEVDFEPDEFDSYYSTNDLVWEFCQLHYDGSWSAWTEFGPNGRGAIFTNVMTGGGVFRVRVETPSGEHFELLRKKDEKKQHPSIPVMMVKYGPGKDGQFDTIGVADTQMQIDIRNAAKGYLASEDYAYNVIVTAAYGFAEFGFDTLKCNIFVAHMAEAAGADVPAINGIFNDYPPLANEWAGVEDTSPFVPGFQTAIDNWDLLTSTNSPQPGYIIAHPKLGDSGHAAIIDYDGGGIGAGMSGTVNKLFPDFYDGTSRDRKYEP